MEACVFCRRSDASAPFQPRLSSLFFPPAYRGLSPPFCPSFPPPYYSPCVVSDGLVFHQSSGPHLTKLFAYRRAARPPLMMMMMMVLKMMMMNFRGRESNPQVEQKSNQGGRPPFWYSSIWVSLCRFVRIDVFSTGVLSRVSCCTAAPLHVAGNLACHAPPGRSCALALGNHHHHDPDGSPPTAATCGSRPFWCACFTPTRLFVVADSPWVISRCPAALCPSSFAVFRRLPRPC